MATSLNEINRTLGVILGKIESIEDRMGYADDGRAKIHSRLDDLVMRTTHLESDVGTIKNKQEMMEKVTVEVTTLRSKAQGAGTLGRLLIKLGIGIVGAAGWLIGVYTWMTGKPPP